MTLVRKPGAALRKLASSQTTAGIRTVETRPALTRDEMVQLDPNQMANVSRLAAGASSGETGFTCVRCLQWFPAGTSHACQPMATVIRNDETKAPMKGPMTQAEIELLQADGQL